MVYQILLQILATQSAVPGPAACRPSESMSEMRNPRPLPRPTNSESAFSLDALMICATRSSLRSAIIKAVLSGDYFTLFFSTDAQRF